MWRLSAVIKYTSHQCAAHVAYRPGFTVLTYPGALGIRLPLRAIPCTSWVELLISWDRLLSSLLLGTSGNLGVSHGVLHLGTPSTLKSEGPGGLCN
jgi:hypothetical protein